MDVAFLAEQASPAGCLQFATLPLMMVAIFYLLVWRPQQKQMDEAKRFRDGLKTDDEVITSGGIYGKVVDVDAESVRIEVARGVKVRVARTQVVKYQDKPASDASESADADKSKK